MENANFKQFIVFWVSQSVSQLGSSMTAFAMTIWVYKETKSALAVSMLVFFIYWIVFGKIKCEQKGSRK